MNILDLVKKNVEPIVLELGLFVWDILFEKEGKNKFLRIYIFKNDGSSVTLDDCEMVSNRVSEKLDEIDIIEERYYLEVSSVGVDGVLTKDKHFANSIGKKIYLKFKKSVGGKRQLKGVLRGFRDGKIKLETKDEVFYIAVKNCSCVKLSE